MRGRRSVGGLIVLWMLASGCSNQATPPTGPSPTQEIPAGGLNASGSGSSGTFTLQVTKNGTGSGTVTSSPSGISCGTTCSRSFSGGTTVTLTGSGGFRIGLRRVERRRLHGDGLVYCPDQQQRDPQRCVHDVRCAASSVGYVHADRDQSPGRGNRQRDELASGYRLRRDLYCELPVRYLNHAVCRSHDTPLWELDRGSLRGQHEPELCVHPWRQHDGDGALRQPAAHLPGIDASGRQRRSRLRGVHQYDGRSRARAARVQPRGRLPAGRAADGQVLRRSVDPHPRAADADSNEHLHRACRRWRGDGDSHLHYHH
jgi:hypothetical protein